jgi:hypothetical protein
MIDPRFHPLVQGFRFDCDPHPLEFNADAIAAADRILAEGAIRHDGEILAVVGLESRRLIAARTHYRFLAACRRFPDLFVATPIRPMAVTGVITVRGQFLFGRRANSVAQEAGAMELVPSGGVEASRVGDDGFIDVCAQLIAELAEETGWAAAGGEACRIIGLV